MCTSNAHNSVFHSRCTPVSFVCLFVLLIYAAFLSLRDNRQCNSRQTINMSTFFHLFLRLSLSLCLSLSTHTHTHTKITWKRIRFYTVYKHHPGSNFQIPNICMCIPPFFLGCWWETRNAGLTKIIAFEWIWGGPPFFFLVSTCGFCLVFHRVNVGYLFLCHLLCTIWVLFSLSLFFSF